MAERHPELTVTTSLALAQETLQEVIEEEGLIPGQVTQISEMMARTAPALGKTANIYQTAVLVPFCSVKVGWALVEEDPRQLTMCPFAIALYILPNAPEVVHISYRSPDATSPARRSAEALLRKISLTTQQRLAGH